MNELPKKPSLLKSWRIWLVVVLLLFSLFFISPQLSTDGVAILSLDKDSNAEQAGIVSPSATEKPTERERILRLNNQPVDSPQAFYAKLSAYEVGEEVLIATSKNVYTVATPLGIQVAQPEKTNIRKGIDLQGGTRILLESERTLDSSELSLLIENMRQRLNVFGLNDVVVRSAQDLSNKTFILVEIAGVNQRSAETLLSRQGKFEGKIANETVFSGGNDILYVCNSATCSGIEPNGCFDSGLETVCGYSFSITLSQEAAQRHFDALQQLTIDAQGQYLSESLVLFLDDEETNSLLIGASLQQAVVTEISISGSGSGPTRKEAITAALEDMRTLQSILITGSLPAKLNIVQSDTVSPILGQQFTTNAIVIVIGALITVAVVVFLVYRKLKVALPIIITSLIELTILLGVSTFLQQHIDLGAVAGIIAAIGTGVNDQIVIADETLRNNVTQSKSVKQRAKNAFFIITGAYLTTAVAMIPLFFAGAGILRGFALITLIGITVGVFITRPAYAKVLEFLLYKKEEEA